YVHQGGNLHEGYLEYNGKIYYMNPGSGDMKVNNWIGSHPDGNYFLSDGAMATGWNLINNEWYYFEESRTHFNTHNGWLSY
ncbi:glucan-binding protein, partial [Bacillus pseudomycoides]